MLHIFKMNKNNKIFISIFVLFIIQTIFLVPLYYHKYSKSYTKQLSIEEMPINIRMSNGNINIFNILHGDDIQLYYNKSSLSYDTKISNKHRISIYWMKSEEIDYSRVFVNITIREKSHIYYIDSLALTIVNINTFVIKDEIYILPTPYISIFHQMTGIWLIYKIV